MTRILLTAVSTPNLKLVLALTQVFSLIDDFTYFVYHDMNYGGKFRLFTFFMWNISNQRFIPQDLARFLYDLQDMYDSSTKSVNRTN